MLIKTRYPNYVSVLIAFVFCSWIINEFEMFIWILISRQPGQFAKIVAWGFRTDQVTKERGLYEKPRKLIEFSQFIYRCSTAAQSWINISNCRRNPGLFHIHWSLAGRCCETIQWSMYTLIRLSYTLRGLKIEKQFRGRWFFGSYFSSGHYMVEHWFLSAVSSLLWWIIGPGSNGRL